MRFRGLVVRVELSEVGTLTDKLKPEDIKHLRTVLKPLRERYDFATTMNRWACEVRASDDDSEPVLPEDGTDWGAHIAELFEPDDPRPQADHAQSIAIARAWARRECSDEAFLMRDQTCAPETGAEVARDPTPQPGKPRPDTNAGGAGGRPRADKERYAALLLAVIYHEYAGESPTRIVKPRERAQDEREYSSKFYKFAGAAFELVGLEPRPQAFREAWKRWKRSRDFSKDAVRALLWGGLPGFKRRAKPHSKRKSPK
jgi:hypothetical protein